MGVAEPILPAPRTWAANDKATAALMNANVRDGVTFRLTPPLFKLSTTVNTSVPTSTFTAIPWATADADTYGGWAVSPNPTRYTCQVAGWYYVAASVQYAPGAGASRRVASLWINGAVARQQEWQPVLTFAAAVPCAGFVFLTKGDYLEFKAWQNTGGALNIGGSPSFIIGAWVHS
jgi:hypothetical protein